jgi:acyl-coenzyme A thioesterase PaaI-like protein
LNDHDVTKASAGARGLRWPSAHRAAPRRFRVFVVEANPSAELRRRETVTIDVERDGDGEHVAEQAAVCSSGELAAVT